MIDHDWLIPPECEKPGCTRRLGHHDICGEDVELAWLRAAAADPERRHFYWTDESDSLCRADEEFRDRWVRWWGRDYALAMQRMRISMEARHEGTPCAGRGFAYLVTPSAANILLEFNARKAGIPWHALEWQDQGGNEQDGIPIVRVAEGSLSGSEGGHHIRVALARMVDTDALAEGIRRTVCLLLDNGFLPTDSGDGSAANARDEFYGESYAAMKVPPDRMVADARRLRDLLRTKGVAVGGIEHQGQPRIYTQYDPADESAMVVLVGVTDRDLFPDDQAEKPRHLRLVGPSA